jgi:hypothetical protein
MDGRAVDDFSMRCPPVAARVPGRTDHSGREGYEGDKLGKLLNVALDEFDPSQRRVIEADCADRLLVDAGPGTGKTAVACARIANLVGELGVNPSRIWMISFTRTAIAEIRARLYSYVGEESFAVKVATLDAHAWALHSGFDDKASLTGSFDQNIESVLDLLKRDDDTQDYLYDVQHLVLDEAQDLVGIRADLVETFIGYLAPECGVTIFADEAQAIYDFAEDIPGVTHPVRRAFVERFREDGGKFQHARLEKVHRTSSEKLQEIFTSVRLEVLQPTQKSGLFGKIKARIEDLVGDKAPSVASAPPWEALSAGDLVLFRTRAEALHAAQFNQSPYSLRIGGYGATLPPWLAICFHDCTDRHIGKAEFADRWVKRVRNTCPPSYSNGEAWERLYRLAGSGDGSLDLLLLRQRLARKSLPVELAEPDYGLVGPIIGTVHASKGREADDVLYYVSDDPEFEDEQSELEETRVMFVGSTRARRSLRLGKAPRSYAKSLSSGRAYKKLKGAAAMLEIGRPSDQDLTGLVGTRLQSQAATNMSQTWLARHSCVMTQLEFSSNPDDDWAYGAVAPLEGTHLTTLTRQFNYDYWELIERIADRKRCRPAPNIRFVKSLGAMTLVAAPDDPALDLLHAPWSRSGFALAPRLSAFTKVFAWKRQ